MGLNKCLLESAEKKKKSDARLEMALNSGEVDVVSVHLVAEIYELYKQKADQLEQVTKPVVSKQAIVKEVSKPVIEKQAEIEREQGDGDSEPTVSGTYF